MNRIVKLAIQVVFSKFNKSHSLPTAAVLLAGVLFLNSYMDTSLEGRLRKGRLVQFREITHLLDPCWKTFRLLGLFTGCYLNDPQLVTQVAYGMTACFLQFTQPACGIQVNPLNCHGSESLQSCARNHSRMYEEKLGYNVFTVVLEGFQHICSQLEPTKDASRRDVVLDSILLALQIEQDNDRYDLRNELSHIDQIKLGDKSSIVKSLVEMKLLKILDEEENPVQ